MHVRCSSFIFFKEFTVNKWFGFFSIFSASIFVYRLTANFVAAKGGGGLTNLLIKTFCKKHSVNNLLYATPNIFTSRYPWTSHLFLQQLLVSLVIHITLYMLEFPSVITLHTYTVQLLAILKHIAYVTALCIIVDFSRHYLPWRPVALYTSAIFSCLKVQWLKWNILALY